MRCQGWKKKAPIHLSLFRIRDLSVSHLVFLIKRKLARNFHQSPKIEHKMFIIQVDEESRGELVVIITDSE